MSDPKPEWHETETRMGDVGATAVRSPGSSSSSAASPAPASASQGTMGGGSFFSAPLFAMGTVLANRYEILEVLGQGGMGAVYKAYDRELERFVALKTIRPELAGNAEMLARFKQELILARQVAHRNIVRLYDISESNGVKFITMEYIEGEDFRGILRRDGKLSPEESVTVIRQICFALQAAHSEGVIHRDLKPQNIMRDKQGRVVVMDFGLARALESDGMTQTGALLGTMEYMSPEQSRGEPVDCTSDIYAAGLIFYELLTGKMPYAAESALASLMKRAQQRAIPAAEIDRSVPRNLSAIVSHCIEPDKKKRYQSASEILADLEAYDPAAKTAVSFVIPYRAQRPQVYKWVAVALLAVLAGGGYLGYRKFASRTVVQHAPVSVLVADFENHTGDPVFDDTLEPMFNTALEDAKFVNAFNRGTAHKLASQLPNHPGNQIDEQAARLIAQAQGINAVITGSISRRGDNEYKISVEAIDGSPNGTTLASNEVTVQGKDQVMLAIPKLVAPIRKALGDTTPESVQLTETQGSFKVDNLEAAHQYGVGMEDQFSGKMQDAFNSFQKAAELDPNFARAYAGMSGMAANLGRLQDSEKYAKLAMEHVDRMTQRERYRIFGLYYLRNEDWHKCVDEYTNLVGQFPADNIGYNNLALCYKGIGDLPKAVEELKKSLQIMPNSLLARSNLALYSSLAGDFQGGEREARAALQLAPNSELTYRTLAYAQIGEGKFDDAIQSYRHLASMGSFGASLAFSGLADISLYQGKFSEATKILQNGITEELKDKSLDPSSDYVALANVQLVRSKTEAMDALKKGLANCNAIRVKFWAARIYVAAGEVEKASQLASDLNSELQPEAHAYAQLIAGEIALLDKDPNQAIALFTAANKTADTWVGHYDLGRAYLDAGLFVEADSEFNRCLERRGEALELFDSPTYSIIPDVYYYQGRVRDGLKSPGASDSYRKYLEIRGAANEDLRLPEIRRRLGQ